VETQRVARQKPAAPPAPAPSDVRSPYITVADSSDLVITSARYRTASVQRDEAEARAARSTAERSRLENLRVSGPALEGARMTAALDRAALEAADAAARAAELALTQRWGRTIARRVLAEGWADDLATGRSALLEVTWPSNDYPDTLALRTSDNRAVVARFVARSPRRNSILLYLATGTGLRPGLTLEVAGPNLIQ
jgi:hypothetical protein